MAMFVRLRLPGCEVHSATRRSFAVTAAFLTGVILHAPVAMAHLSIIRQGAESRGSFEAGDEHGYAVAAGDFNGDGYDDLATGAPFEDVSSAADGGAVVVNFGSHFGLTHVGAALLQESDFSINSPNDQFGFALTSGDFNEDGFDDLAVAAPGADLGLGGENIGGIFVYHGSATGLFPAYDLTQGDAGGTHEAGDRFGAALCTGDFNGDGAADIGVGSPGEDGSAGAAFFFSGGLFGLVTGPQGWFKQSSLGQSNVAGDGFGSSVAAGNVVGSSHDDLIIGAPFRDHHSLVNPGAVYVVLGSASGPAAATRRLYDASIGDLGGPQTSGLFGSSVAAGHLYSGSWDGLVIGEPGRNTSASVLATGRVVIGKGGSSDVDWVGAERVVLTQASAGEPVLANEFFGLKLEAGVFDTNDGFEDLVVGSPRDKFTSSSTSTGWVGIFPGSSSGPTGGGTSFFQSTCTEPVEGGDIFGSSLCLGEFDGSGKGNLAAGAPGEDGLSGSVHVIAPWRQVLSTDLATQLAVDCEGNPVFSVKPFDQVCIASTTKTMTVLIACERSQLPPSDPAYVSLDAEYTVPEWIRNNVGGSLYGFRTAETMTLRDLLYACIFPSGNDAAYAIADLLTGEDNTWTGYATTCLAFVTEMNVRAAQLGMTHTVFTNPAGLDVGNHGSTAYDMYLLGRAAMANPLMASVVSSRTDTFTSKWLNSNGDIVSGPVTQSYGFLQNLQSRNTAFRGVKPGKTPCAGRTGVMAAEAENGKIAIATAFGHDTDLPRSGFYDQVASLMGLALEECGTPFLIDPSEFVMNWGLGDLSTSEGAFGGGGSSFETWNADTPFAVIDLFRASGSGLTAARFDVQRSSDVYFEPNGEATFGIAPFEFHEEIALANLGENLVRFSVELSYGDQYEFELPAGARAIIPCIRDPEPSFWFRVRNLSGGGASLPMNLGVTEPYGFELSNIPVGAGSLFSAKLERSDGSVSDGFRLLVTGRDPNPGQSLYAAVHDEGVVVEVEVDGTPSIVETEAAILLSAGPNPFADRATLAFHLRSPANAALRFLDAQGRVVRRIDAKGAPAGRVSFDWDGHDDEGREVPRGVYFYQLQLDGQAHVSGRISVIR